MISLRAGLMTMKHLLLIYLFHTLFEAGLSAETSPCMKITYKQTNNVGFRCTQLTTLQNYLDQAMINTTIITIFDSNIPNVPGHSFARFGATLVTLDLHESGIQTCDAQAFVGLTKLEKLMLWGNKLTFVPADWFVNMYSLQTLDLSFNFIQGIDFTIFQMLPNLKNFYFDYNQLRYIDYNMFAYLGNLKRVKFSKNPLSWPYRARLTWQLENQKVEVSDTWEDWNWMNVVIKDCVESGRGELPSDKVLDCVVEKLLIFAYETFSAQERSSTAGCNKQAKRLVRCMRPMSTNATGNTDYETVRRILEDYSTILPPMERALSPFPLKREQ
ncbi:leucine-rich repeat transmembrane neuronal protein 2-like isoform X2 [Cataglyphis hispanica]|uniref:leucine-rich repeat transmembrane neuronal protein 2-like isoform X2 n=1 Tax=Cataglyphis hispanica TaxID=1086592 RepID=UPI0021808A5A|nr:leucine-rich repeat transmembrane neuronal protein 2-like isoform X2 [Cataglyphis hispanica]